MRWGRTCVLPLLLAFIEVSQAQPIKFWPSEGVAVTTASGIQGAPVALGDGAGGAIFLWEDSRTTHGKPDLFGQRFNANGVSQWQVNGAPFTTVQDSAESAPSIISDGAGGAIFTWQDNRTLQNDIYAQRIDSNGVRQWQANGVPVSTACWPGGSCANQKQKPQITSDGAGGAIIAWYEMRDGFHFSVWAQRVSANGTPLWTLDGMPVVTGTFNADFPKIISDGSGGAIVIWQDARNSNYRIYAQRLNASGAPQWTVNGIEVSPAIAQRGLSGHVLIGDGAGGTIIAWVDGRVFNDANIYAQRLNTAGQIQWQADGVPIVTRTGHQYSPAMATDAAGGAILTWEDQGASPPGSGRQWILAQRVSALGVPLWTADGMPICTSCHAFSPSIVSDGAGGGIIVWDDLGPRIRAQRVNGNGAALWIADGFEVYVQPGGSYGFSPKAVSDGSGGAIIYWSDYRFDAGTGTIWDIFAQRVNDHAAPPPTFGLTVSTAGPGSATVSSIPAGISCGASCSASFNEGMVVTLTTSPNAGSSFAGWSGGGCSGFGNCQITMSAAKSVTATFNVGTTAIRVPADLPTIQAAVSAAVNGHTVLVAPGTYVDNINFSGKTITVVSESGPEVTIIDGNQTDSVVKFTSGEGPLSVLSGFTLRNGRANVDTSTGEGGGILVDHSSPTIVGNIIANNEACFGGGGIAVVFGSPFIQGNTIRNNGREVGCSGGGGGGILVRGYTPGSPAARILDNVISDNAAWDGYLAGDGGGIYINAGGPLVIRGNVISRNSAGGGYPCAFGGGIATGNSSDPLIVQNVITGNSATCGGGLFWAVTTTNPGPLLVNNTIAANDSALGSAIFAEGFDAQTQLINNIIVGKAGQTAVYCGNTFDQNPPVFKSNNVFTPSGSAYGGICANQTGINGNISSDPLFVDQASGNYRLQPGSLSVDAGDNTAPQLTANDLAGNARITDGNADGIVAIDIGAYERPGATAKRRHDFNGDGRSDILWRNSSTGENYLYPMNGTAILGTEGYLRTVPDLNWKVVGLGDFDGDGKADILWRNASSGQNYIYFMDGLSIKPTEGYLRTVADQNWQVAGVGDFNGDGKADILWRNSVSGENYLYPMDGLIILGTEGYLRTVADLNWGIAGVGDFDGEGKADVLWRNASTGENYLYPMDGTTIKPTEGYLRTVADLNWKIAGVGDFNGDGKGDVLWRNSASGENYLYPMDGRTILGTEGYLRTVTDQNWQVKGTGDYDGDGKADVLWRNAATGENYLYPMDGTTIKPTEGYLRAVPQPDWRIQSPTR